MDAQKKYKIYDILHKGTVYTLLSGIVLTTAYTIYTFVSLHNYLKQPKEVLQENYDKYLEKKKMKELEEKKDFKI